MAQESSPITVKAGSVQVSVEPVVSAVTPDQVFTVDIQVVADSQLVDGAEVHLDFDAARLLVVNASGQAADNIEGSGVLDVALQNMVDNEQGHIDFAAGTFSGGQSGTFVLATIRFKALQGTDGGSTALLFVSRSGSPTDVTHRGASVLGATTGGTISIMQDWHVHLPLVSY